MFYMEVDKNTQITFLHHSFHKRFSMLYKSNKRKGLKWFNQPITNDSELDFLALINQSLHEYATGSAVNCAIFYKQELIGCIGLININHHLHKAELSYWLSQHYIGRGITTASCQRMIDYAFNFLKLNKLEMAVDTANTDYRKTCELLNFELEGILKHAENINGQVVNHAQYGLLKETD